jgi:anthranilate/para-aminobenzoate synthase component I
LLRPDYKEFSRLARDFTLVPVVKSVAADLLTPVSAFLAIAADEPDAFLLESVERGEQIGRYTFWVRVLTSRCEPVARTSCCCAERLAKNERAAFCLC